MFEAIGDGFRRLLQERGVVFLVWMLGFLLVAPAAWQLTDGIHESVRHSRVSEKLEGGFDMGWYGEFHAEARGVEQTFSPTVTGAGAFYSNLESWLTGSFVTLPPALLGLGCLYVLVWLFLQGGIVARLARPSADDRLAPLLATGARFFGRFLRLFLISGVLYGLIYLGSRRAYQWLGHATRDVTSESMVFLVSLAFFAVTALLLLLVHLGASFAKIATVREDRRGMLRAMLFGLRLVLRHPLGTGGLVLFLALVSVVLLIAYAAVAPVAGPSSYLGVFLAFAGAQVYLIVKVFLRLWLLAGQGSLYSRFTLPVTRP